MKDDVTTEDLNPDQENDEASLDCLICLKKTIIRLIKGRITNCVLPSHIVFELASN